MDQVNPDHESIREGPTPGNLRRARQLSDVMFLRISGKNSPSLECRRQARKGDLDSVPDHYKFVIVCFLFEFTENDGLSPEMVHIGGLHPVFQDHDIEIVKVRLLPDMRNLHIFWATTGNPLVDAEVGRALTSEVAWQIRRQLADLKVMLSTRLEFFRRVHATL